jgi:hypothetical protein
MAQASRTAFDRYLQLTQQGVPPPEAYRQAFPQGMYTGQKTPEQQAKEQAKQQQKAGLAKVGGALVGALAVKGAGQALSGERVFGETRDNLGKLVGLGKPATPTGATAARVAGPATPGGLSATRVTELPAGSTMTPEGNVLSPDGTVKDAATGSNIGSWLQGATGALLVYQGVKQYQAGEKIGGALNVASGAANVAAAAGSSTAGNLVPGLNIAAGTYGLGKMALKSGDYSKSQKGQTAAQGAMAGAQLGAGIGSIVPGVGTAIGAGIGAVLGGTYGFISGFSGSGKGLRQKVRDKWREAMLENNVGLFDENYQGTLPDGSTFDWGKDKFTFGKKEGDIDLENPVVGKAAAYGNVLAAIQGATETKPREAIAAQFLKAGTTNASDDMEKMRGNMKYFFNKLGMDGAGAQAELDRLKEDGKLNDEEYQVYSNDLAEMLR